MEASVPMTLGAALLAPQPLAAMIAGGFVALGWVTTHVLSIRRDRAQRAERVRDVQGALYAEIRVYTDTLESQRLATYGAEIEAQILGRPGFFPVIPTENNDRIFAAIVEEIHVLPFHVVDPVVRYYNQLSVIGAMIADLRALDPVRVGPDRAARMYRHYIEMKLEAIDLGGKAKLFLHTHLTGGNPAVADLAAAHEKARIAEARSGLHGWIAAHRTGAAGDGPISPGRSPASGRSGQ